MLISFLFFLNMDIYGAGAFGYFVSTYIEKWRKRISISSNHSHMPLLNLSSKSTLPSYFSTIDTFSQIQLEKTWVESE